MGKIDYYLTSREEKSAITISPEETVMKKETERGTKTLADWAYLAIDKHFHKVLKHEAGVLQDEDPEELHQMRVGTRRLRSALTGFAPALGLPKNTRPEKVGKIARILGELRDLDVLKESLISHYEPVLPPEEQKSLQRALEALESGRKESFEKVSHLLQSPLYGNFRQGFKEWLEKPSYQPLGQLAIETVLPDLLLPQASRFLLHEGWMIGVNGESDRTPEAIDRLLATDGLVLHELRKEAKRSRYNMELFAEFYGKKYRKYLEDIKQIQSILGDIQDCHVLAEFLAGIYGDSLAGEMPTLLETFQQIRSQKWREWRPLQEKFLSSKTRRSLHETILNPTFEENGVESEVDPDS
jgi:CHAD domain-containing protein